jgi:hypothetical protein
MQDFLLLMWCFNFTPALNCFQYLWWMFWFWILQIWPYTCLKISIFFSDFGSVFSTLLPGTMAKLEPPEGCSFLDGLEVRVAFGSVWKQSLSELSGGQRSLLALSLILALLLFKPAPLYILDEVYLTKILHYCFGSWRIPLNLFYPFRHVGFITKYMSYYAR